MKDLIKIRFNHHTSLFSQATVDKLGMKMSVTCHVKSRPHTVYRRSMSDMWWNVYWIHRNQCSQPSRCPSQYYYVIGLTVLQSSIFTSVVDSTTVLCRLVVQHAVGVTWQRHVSPDLCMSLRYDIQSKHVVVHSTTMPCRVVDCTIGLYMVVECTTAPCSS